MEVRLRSRSLFLWFLVALLATPSLALAKKCTKVLPPEAFAFYGQKPSDVDCSDYEYRVFDLNDDGVDEFAVTNYVRAGDTAGYFPFEIWQQRDGKWVRISTIPGRPTILPTMTNGYHNLGATMLGHYYVYGWDGTRYRDLAQIDQSDERTRTPTTPTPAPSPTPKPKPTPTPPPSDDGF